MSNARTAGFPGVGVTRRAHLLLVTALVLAGAGLLAPDASSAAFVTHTRNTVSTVTAAPDWTPPTVSLQHPGSPVKDTVSLTGTAVDRETGISNVVISYLAPGSSVWVDVCTATVAPYTCAWNTKPLADGSYGLRARATDNAGYASTSTPLTTTVANSLLVTLADPGDAVRGTVALPTTLQNTGAVSYTVRVEYSPAGANSWKSLCSNLSSPYTCSWSTTGFANDYYDLRAVAVSGGTTSSSAVVSDVLVDNQAPSVTMLDPGSPLSGTRSFEATASDAHSGIAQVALQYATAGTTTYKALCAVTGSPYSCRVDTTTLLDGTYSLRAVATDAAGNVTTSAPVTNRVVDNTVSSVSVEDPGGFLAGLVTLSAAASSTAGVSSVSIQRAPGGSTTWTDVCTDVSAPYTCTWDTTTVANGLYDVRAVLVDGTGRVTTSAVISSRRVDNSPLRGVDVQTLNGGSTPGRLEASDTITFTYSERVNLATVAPGWNGVPISVTARVRDGNLLSRGNTGDTLDVLRNSNLLNLGSVNLRGDYVKTNKTVTISATLTAGTVTVNGIVRSTITLQLGTVAGGNNAIRTAGAGAAMVWTPSAVVSDLFGVACSAAPVAETGALDVEF